MPRPISKPIDTNDKESVKTDKENKRDSTVPYAEHY